MQLLFTGITFLALIIIFCCDCSGKFNKLGTARGIIYLLFIYVLSIMLSWNIDELEYDLDPSRYDDFWSFITKCADWQKIVEILVQIGIVIIGVLLSIIATVIVVRKELKDDNVPENLYKSMKLVTVFAFSEVFAGTASIIMAAIALIYGTNIIGAEILAITVVAILMIVLMIILTFGIGIPIIIIVLPVFIVGVGIDAIIHCFPFIAMSIIWGLCFTIIHIMTIVFSVCIIKKCRKEDVITKTNAVIFGILQAVPILNIISSIILKSKIKRYDN